MTAKGEQLFAFGLFIVCLVIGVVCFAALAPEKPEEPPAPPEDKIAIAVTPGRDDLLRWVNIFLEDHQIDFDAATLIAQDGRFPF